MSVIKPIWLPLYLTGIDFTEFLDMYKRLFVLSKSVVSQDVHDIVRNSPRSTALPEINHNKPNKVYLVFEKLSMYLKKVYSIVKVPKKNVIA